MSTQQRPYYLPVVEATYDDEEYRKQKKKKKSKKNRMYGQDLAADNEIYLEERVVGSVRGSRKGDEIITGPEMYFEAEEAGCTLCSFYDSRLLPKQSRGLALGGWRWSYFLAAIPGIAVAALLFLTVKDPPRQQSEPDKDADKEQNTMSVKYKAKRVFTRFFNPSVMLLLLASSIRNAAALYDTVPRTISVWMIMWYKDDLVPRAQTISVWMIMWYKDDFVFTAALYILYLGHICIDDYVGKDDFVFYSALYAYCTQGHICMDDYVLLYTSCTQDHICMDDNGIKDDFVYSCSIRIHPALPGPRTTYG
ncbi:unnamed protein product [Mytilus edulis]|uniref:Uncharacterized protein n=1 Tax=Mytilus edulis TaxID=6550 RepID=A0A8S3RU18_MYTED|nr:unnamed protein product [Mytilus edulis]